MADSEDFEPGAKYGYKYGVRVNRRSVVSGYVAPAVGGGDWAPGLTPLVGGPMRIITTDDDGMVDQVIKADLRRLPKEEVSRIVDAAHAACGPNATHEEKGLLALRALDRAARALPPDALAAAAANAPAALPGRTKTVPRIPDVSLLDHINTRPAPAGAAAPAGPKLRPRSVLVELPGGVGQLQCVYDDVAVADDLLILARDPRGDRGYAWVPPKRKRLEDGTLEPTPQIGVLVYDEDGHMETGYAVRFSRGFTLWGLQVFLFDVDQEKDFRDGDGGEPEPEADPAPPGPPAEDATDGGA